eukprot:CAMPEP_0170454848 /NCGR_PEP_ID=MMETSP0123-20130129/2961_1 /TAXON_ID=182087 /ORGANISM="Favella ehrenbergii, Strain Fehren 1" /LENGTH=38 /DNA_ID= /DNA_START= /DNA_END= /DNA_ORIENTATION=
MAKRKVTRPEPTKTALSPPFTLSSWVISNFKIGGRFKK